MSVFNAKNNSGKLEFDFTGFQRSDGQGNCRGSGVMPEPTLERLDAWYSASVGLRRPPLPQRASQVPQGEKIAATRTDMVRAISAVGDNSPSIAELEELPYRALLNFFRWVDGQLTPLEAVGMG